MSAIFPTLPGLAFPITRTPKWSTIVQTSTCGLSSAVGLYPYPLWGYTLIIEFMRDDPTYGEFQDLMSTFLISKGRATTFLFDDPKDNYIGGQFLGTANGTLTDFYLWRTKNGITEPVYEINTNEDVRIYIDTVEQETSAYTYTAGVGSTPAKITFTTAPTSGYVTADFNFYWRCRFDDDSLDFEQFVSGFWSVQQIKFTTVL